ncbi:ATP-binding protein [Alkanindiges sp. WGS2144]|uniref:ATP-binding protein n=1 Tax=Alkanindiges sp. WGS2144 TaxID=3366808 RepID=UPI003750E216
MPVPTELEAPYRPRERTAWESFLDKIKPRSTAMRTTVLVSIVVFFSLVMSLAFFWRTLYLPEILQHARYLAIELDLLEQTDLQVSEDPFSFDLHDWLEQRVGVQIIRDPALFPTPREKVVAEFFTGRLEKELTRELNEPVTVYFEFKPTPQLWIHYPSLGKAWIREPLDFYAEYSSELILAWLLGIPLLTAIIILTLVRQLNRPLRRLQNAAREFTQTGKAPYLETNHGPIEIRQVNAAFNHMISTLQQAAQERTIMLAGISHDLRTPLTRIRLTAELMPDEDLQQGLIYDVDDMDAILGQFISYMRDGSDEKEQATDINALMQEIIIQFKPLHIIYQPQLLPSIQVRSLSIKRMIGNLVSNAKRYGAEPVYLSASLLGAYIIITVRDSGDGVNQDEIESLMQPFIRGNSARTTQGSGLGLAIVKRIAELHGGYVNARNHPDGGLEVSVGLPLHATTDNTAKTENSTLSKLKSKLTGEG